MTNVIQISRAEREKPCVVALHCSLGSGRQWKALADQLGRSQPFFAPDIAGYGANLRLEKLGDTLTVFTEITLNDHHREDFFRFETAIRDVDEIMECHLVSGGYDYLLRFLTRGVNHYQQVIEGLLERNIGIEKYFSYIVIKSPFIKTHYPIEGLFPPTI